jgi:hypothetical protein
VIKNRQKERRNGKKEEKRRGGMQKEILPSIDRTSN